ncbi:MAG TPA: cytochrome c oxidase subunit 3 [Acidimicrobiales bacterium]|jgi:cytochrome c oxidase subunit 3|nr:cytochrome c oxidase subunit 3 [Acidimicrobiales bacterium]
MAAVTGIPGTGRRPTPLSVGVVVWLASELMFFSGLFAAYFTLRATDAVWPPPDVDLATGRTAIATVILIASSFTMHLASRAASENRRTNAVQWLAITALMGVAFLSNQVLEYAEAPFSISSHAYGSIFYLMTGFHGLHVIGGLLFMVAVSAAILGRTSRAPAHSTLEVCAFYWHFVDVVWVAMFLTIYVLQ